MRNKLVLAALLLVGVASVAYAAFSQTLTINGTGASTGTWNVNITGITLASSAGATEVAAPTFTTTSATFNVQLAYPGAYATYDVAIANTGNIAAKLSTINGVTAANAASPTYITYTVTGVAANDVLAATTGTDTATVKVEWDPLSTSTTLGSKTATITLDYVQNP